jgi:hypothetical protein
MSAIFLLALSAHAADPGTANFTNKGFRIADAAGQNTVFLGAFFQPSYVLALNGDPAVADADVLGDSGFRVRHMLLLVSGTLAGNLDFRLVSTRPSPTRSRTLTVRPSRQPSLCSTTPR